MGNKNEALFMEEWVVIDFLKEIKNPFKNSKYIELLIALSLNKFCEKQWNCKCLIGLEIQDKYKRDIPKQGIISLEGLNEIITRKVEENTSIDIIIAKPPINKSDNGQGMNFQIKRFGKNPYKHDTQSLINFLNNDCRKYCKSRISLVVVIESPKEIDLKLLQKSINTQNYPFEKIILIGMAKDNCIDYYGIWPESGYSRFNYNTLKFDF